jgi:hypothetical protein
VSERNQVALDIARKKKILQKTSGLHPNSHQGNQRAVMSFSKRSFFLLLGLLLGAMCPPGARASGVEVPLERPTIDTTVPDSDTSLPDDPGAGIQQQVQSGSGTPATQPPAQSSAAESNQGRQTKRILFVVPNFRAVSADQHLPPQTVKDKFKTAFQDSLDYSSFIFVGGQAGVAMANKSYPEFRQGAAGYGRYYWHTLADAINENTFVEFIMPVVLHEDTRYYTLGHGGVAKRLGYAFSRVAVTRTDSGHRTFNASEFAGAGAFAGVSNLYYPSQERTFTKTYQRWITNLAIDSCTFAFKEIWPDINGAIFHQRD